jgi:hypothetical protein
MGAKYRPTHKDLQATRRFQERQARARRDQKLAALPAARAPKAK